MSLVLREAGLRQITCIVRERQLRLYGHMAQLPAELDFSNRIFLIGFFLSRSEELDHGEGASTGFVFASGGVLSEEYGHDGFGVCLGDGQTEAEGVPSQGGRDDALLRRTPPHLT